MEKKKAFWILSGGRSCAAVDKLLSMQSRTKSGQLRKSTVENIAAKYGCTVTWTYVF